MGRKYLEMTGHLFVIKLHEYCNPLEIEDNMMDTIKSAYFLPEKVYFNFSNKLIFVFYEFLIINL